MVMTYHAPSPCGVGEDVLKRMAALQLLVLDMDGVLTDSKIWMHEDGTQLRAFHAMDGLGVQLLVERGLRVAIISGTELEVLAQQRAARMRVTRVYSGISDKLTPLNEILQEWNIAKEETAFMGDDLPDLPPMKRVGLGLSVPNAHPWVQEAAHYVTQNVSGGGAVREVCDLILHAKGWLDDVRAFYSRC